MLRVGLSEVTPERLYIRIVLHDTLKLLLEGTVGVEGRLREEGAESEVSDRQFASHVDFASEARIHNLKEAWEMLLRELLEGCTLGLIRGRKEDICGLRQNIVHSVKD